MDKILNYKTLTLIKYSGKLRGWNNNFVSTGLVIPWLFFSTIISSLWDYPVRDRMLVDRTISKYLSPVGMKFNCSDNRIIL